jgi:hypothetical protein
MHKWFARRRSEVILIDSAKTQNIIKGTARKSGKCLVGRSEFQGVRVWTGILHTMFAQTRLYLKRLLLLRKCVSLNDTVTFVYFISHICVFHIVNWNFVNWNCTF